MKTYAENVAVPQEGLASSKERPKEIEDVLLEKANEFLRDLPALKVLEAGCGTRTHFRFNADVDLSGIDVSQESLESNPDVRHKMLGDLQTYPLPANEYHVVICWNVIEHVSNPRKALSNMFQSLRPGGLLLIGFPNLLSFKGLVTKYSPHWFHELFFKFMGSSFKRCETYLRWAMIPSRVTRYAAEHGMKVAFIKLEEGTVQRKFRTRLPIFGVLFALIDKSVRLVTFGRGPTLYHDYCSMMLRKKDA